jgi:5-methyltetrahydropteroyltriglutamate--homocysteine methyltransferase
MGPVFYLLLAKTDKTAPKSFETLSLLDSLLPVYKYIG